MTAPSRPPWGRWSKRIAGALALLLTAVVVVGWASTRHFASFGGRPSSAARARLEASGRFHDGLGPLGALQAFAELRARRLLPIHWSTFALGFHAWSEPAETLTVEAEKRGVVLLTPRLGEPVQPDQDLTTPRWWRALPPVGNPTAGCP